MAVYPQVVINDATYLQAESFSAQDDRRDRQELNMGPGVYDKGAFEITLVSGRTVRAAPGIAYVKGRNVADQGFYRQHETVNRDVTLNAGDPTNPRIDQVIIRVMDNAHDISGFNESRIEAVPGTPAAGATLDNRNGALNLEALGEASKNYLLLADVLVPAGATTIISSDIRDRRIFCSYGTIPPLITDIDMVAFLPLAQDTVPEDVGDIDHTAHDLRQSAALFYLPRRIESATRIRWKYLQWATTAAAGNYNIGIYDASGRKIVETGSIAFTGASGTQQVRSETIAATTFEAGLYYVVVGVDTTAGRMHTRGVRGWTTSAASRVGPTIPNTVLRSATGGVVLPATILSFVDVATTTAGENNPTVPAVALSVG